MIGKDVACIMNFKENESAQKLQGSYYTPKWISDYVARWIWGYSPQSVLEPSCGDGIFFQSLSDTYTLSSAVDALGFDTDPLAIEQCLGRSITSEIDLKVRCEDFLTWSIKNIQSECPEQFDAVVGNPPFIRYQYLDKEMQQSAQELFALMGLKFTKHANAWLPFLLASIRFLKPGGHIGMIIPSEILHVLYAQGIREYLIQNCVKILLIDPEDIWFEGTLQGAMLLMAEKKEDSSSCAELGIERTTGQSFTENDPRKFFEEADYLPSSFFSRKWTYALLTKREAEAFNRVKASNYVFSFKEIADVDVGIVTGANKYFLVPDSVIKEYGLSDVAHPMFGRSEHCQGRNGMHQAAASIHTDVALHSEFPLIALFRLVHFRITGFLRVLCGAGSIDDGCVHNGATLHHMSGLHHYPVDRIEIQLVQTMRFQQMAKVAQSGFVWYGFRHKVNAREFSHGIAVVYGILGCRIGKVEPDLKQIHPQHFLNTHGRTTTLSLGIVGLDYTYSFVPENDLVHDFQKFLPLRFLLAEAIFDICKGFLFHCLAPPLL